MVQETRLASLILVLNNLWEHHSLLGKRTGNIVAMQLMVFPQVVQNQYQTH
jgi:hypothetical protein